LLPLAVIRHGVLANLCGEETLHSLDQLDNCEPLKEYTVELFTKKIQLDATVYQNFISYLYEAQHVSGDTPPVIRSLKLR